eukprot:2090568-Amphidinium_carterae.2
MADGHDQRRSVADFCESRQSLADGLCVGRNSFTAAEDVVSRVQRECISPNTACHSDLTLRASE